MYVFHFTVQWNVSYQPQGLYEETLHRQDGVIDSHLCENLLNMSMINVCLAKLQTYGIFRVMDRVQS